MKYCMLVAWSVVWLVGLLVIWLFGRLGSRSVGWYVGVNANDNFQFVISSISKCFLSKSFFAYEGGVNGDLTSPIYTKKKTKNIAKMTII